MEHQRAAIAKKAALSPAHTNRRLFMFRHHDPDRRGVLAGRGEPYALRLLQARLWSTLDGPIGCVDGTNGFPMALRSGTSRVFLALYLAFGLPLCCCQILAAAACCSPSGPSQAAVFRAVDDHAHDGHHHDHGNQHRDEIPGDDPTPSPAIPCDHDGSCKCECDGTRPLLIEKSITIDCTVLGGAAVGWALPVTTVSYLSVRPLAISAAEPPKLSSSSLVRMHCALII